MEARKRVRNGNNYGMPRKVPAPANPTGLFYAREHAGISQDELAARSGANKPMISKLESGARELTRAWAEKFAGPLRVSAIRIVFWDKVGPMEPGQIEDEYAVPLPLGRITAPTLPLRDVPAKASKSRQKPLRSSVVTVYLAEWRAFMGAKPGAVASALGLSADEYEELEAFPFRMTADDMAKVAKAIGVTPSQLFFPVTPAQLTEDQRKLPAGIRLIKQRA